MGDWLQEFGGIWAAILLSAMGGALLSWFMSRPERMRGRLVLVGALITAVLVGSVPIAAWLTDVLEDRPGPANLSVRLRLRLQGAQVWNKETWAAQGDVVEYMIEVSNEGPRTAHDLAVGFNSAPNQRLIPNSVKVANSTHPDGYELLDEEGGRGGQHLLTGGIDIGHYSPGANVFVHWSMLVDPKLPEKGVYIMNSFGVARAAGNNGPTVEDSATLRVRTP